MSDGETQVIAKTLEEAIIERRSIRAYLDKPVPQELMDKVFALAQHAPSNCNVQPWKVFVASDTARNRIRERLIAAVMEGVESVPDFGYTPKFEGEYRKRQVACAVAMYGNMGIARDDSAGRARASLRNFELFDAPHVAFIGMHKDFGASVAIDVGIYLQTLMLAMTAHGISSCAQATMRYYPDIVREEFSGNDDIRVLAGVSFGYADPELPVNATVTTREEISASVTFLNE